MNTINKFLKLLVVMLLFIQTTTAQQISNNIENSLVKNCGSCGLTSRLSINGGFSIDEPPECPPCNPARMGFGLDYFHALKTSQIFDRWGNRISWGINTGGSFFNGSVAPFSGSLPDPFKVDEQTFNAVTGSNNSKSSRYFVGLGPQLNFAIADRFVFSPIFQVGYLGLSQDEFIATQTVTTQAVSPPYTTTTKTYDLLIQTESRSMGVGFIPKARISYMITNKIGFWAEASYLIGPNIKNSIRTFTPEPLADSSGAYTLQQMNFGTYSTEIKKNRFNSLGFNFGVVFSLGGKTKINNPKKPKPLEPVVEINPIIEEMKFPIEIQKIIDEQDNLPIKNFEYNNPKSMQSLCNFNIEKVDIKCDGKDKNGSKKYKVTITYKNLALTGTASLGHYLNACIATTTNGSYLVPMPAGSATFSNLLPNTTSKTPIAPGSSQNITFDFVPNSNFTNLNIKGNLINSASDCGNCDDIISLKLPDCCVACELNPVVAINNSIAVINPNEGTISVTNTVSSPNMITRIEADLVSVISTPVNYSCNKCNDKVKQQNNFVLDNKIINSLGWANAGQSIPKPYFTPGVCRALVFNSATASGINISSGLKISHTIGVAPTSCCGDNVEIWIRYSVWDKDCKVCDQLVKSTISRQAACNGNTSGSGSNNTNH